MQFFIVLAGLVAGVISGTIVEPEDYLTSTMPSLTADTVCPGKRHFLNMFVTRFFASGFFSSIIFP
jgi:hypothetical protein